MAKKGKNTSESSEDKEKDNQEEIVEDQPKKGKKKPAKNGSDDEPAVVVDDDFDIVNGKSKDRKDNKDKKDDKDKKDFRTVKPYHKPIDVTKPIGELSIEDILSHLITIGTESLNPQLKDGALTLLRTLKGTNREGRSRFNNNYGGHRNSHSRTRGYSRERPAKESKDTLYD